MPFLVYYTILVNWGFMSLSLNNIINPVDSYAHATLFIFFSLIITFEIFRHGFNNQLRSYFIIGFGWNSAPISVSFTINALSPCSWVCCGFISSRVLWKTKRNWKWYEWCSTVSLLMSLYKAYVHEFSFFSKAYIWLFMQVSVKD